MAVTVIRTFKDERGRYRYELDDGRIVSRQRVAQMRNREAGLCTWCGNPVQTFERYCDLHHAFHLAYQRQQRRRIDTPLQRA